MDNDTTNLPVKRCTKCGKEFPETLENFPRQRLGRNGLRAQCKNCEREYRIAYEESHPEKIQAKRQRDLERLNRKYREDLEYREKQKATGRIRSNAYYHQNRDEILEREKARRGTDEYRAKRRAYQRRRRKDPEYQQDRAKYASAYYRRNRDKILNRVAIYNIQNPHVMKATRLRRKARKRSLPDTFTARHWTLCLEYFRNRCAVCESQLRDLFGDVEPHADHWIPLNNPMCLGTTPDNMICLCSTCNLSKSDKDPVVWVRENFSKAKSSEILKRVQVYFDWISRLPD